MEKLDDKWLSRDYPTLVAIMRKVENGTRPIQAWDLGDSGLTASDLEISLRALESRGYIDTTQRAGRPDGVEGVSGAAYIAVGLHPDGEDARAELVRVFTELAEGTEDQEQKTLLRKSAEAAGSFSRDVAVGVVSALALGAGRVWRVAPRRRVWPVGPGCAGGPTLLRAPQLAAGAREGLAGGPTDHLMLH